MGSRFSKVAAKIVVHRKRVHVAVFILTILMIPGALTALQPIDMESYEMESPELSAQTTIDDEFPTSEIILGFVVAVRDPSEVEPLDEWGPVPTIDGGTPDYSSIPPISEILEPGEAWKGVTEPDGGILTRSGTSAWRLTQAAGERSYRPPNDWSLVTCRHLPRVHEQHIDSD